MSTVSSPIASSSVVAAAAYLSPFRSINTSPSAGTDAGIQTASESECNTEDDDSSLDTVSVDGHYAVQLHESGSGSDLGNESHATISSRRSVRRIRRPPVIFFGTPSKAEHERRDKYNAKVRTRRLLRKDSIELTRRKSGGWEGGNSIARAEADDPAKCDGATGSEEEDVEASRQASPSYDAASAPSKTQMPLDLNSLSVALPAMNLDEAQESHPEDDPDATEEADWFGMKQRSQRLERSSLPSTPIRRRASKALSDAGSSPGIGRAFSVNGSSRPSPFFRTRDGRRSFASPGLSSNHSAATSPRFNDENVDMSCGSFYAPSPSIAGAAKILQESPRKGNANPSAPLSMSPLKLDLRQKMAAWAETKVKTPQSPEKREWEQLSSSMSAGHALRSPSLSRSARSVAAFEMAKSIPLPDSPEKRMEFKSVQLNRPDIISHLSESTSPSPAKQTGHDRQPPSSQTRLPRPVSAVPGKTLPPSISRQTVGPSHTAKVSVPVKRAVSSQLQTVNRLASDKFHQNNLHRSMPSSSSSSTATSSPHDPFGRRAKFAGTASSSPLKATVKATAPIVRDARLIASRRPEAEKSNPHQSSVTADERVVVPVEVQDVRGDQEVAAIVPAKRIVTVSSAGVGGARRVVLVSTQQPKVFSASTGKGQGQSARLRTQGIGSQAEGSKLKVVPNRTMRRINDYVQRPSIAEKAAVVDTKVLSVAKTAVTRDVFRAAPAIPLQRSLHTQVVVPKGEVQELVRTPADLPTEAENRSERQAMPAQRAHSSATSRLLPLSGAELSKLTSLHTQCNETSVSQIRLVIVRKHGEVRPASPSSKFRKSSSIAASVSKSERLAREAQDRESRAAQRSARFSGDSDGIGDEQDKAATAAAAADESGNLLMPGAFHQPPPSKHRLGAGDEEPFNSPLRRVSLKKNVRWHRALFDRSSAVHSVGLVSSRNASQPIRSSLRQSCRTLALDRFGNVAKAGKPMNASDAKQQQQVVRVTRIVYDDDVVDSMDS